MKEETPGVFNHTHLLAGHDMASSATSRTWPLGNDNSYALRTVPYLATEEYNSASHIWIHITVLVNGCAMKKCNNLDVIKSR
jgi:hypothetical protein